ncbi:MAG: hypothetical protein ABS920_07245 [Sporosarcina sp.]
MTSKKITPVEASAEAVGATITEIVTTKQNEEKAASVKPEAVFIYVGPTTKVVTKYASFIGGLPPHLKEHYEKCKTLEKLFVPAEQFTEFELNVADANSVERMLYDKVYKYFSEVK